MLDCSVKSNYDLGDAKDTFKLDRAVMRSERIPLTSFSTRGVVKSRVTTPAEAMPVAATCGKKIALPNRWIRWRWLMSRLIRLS